MEIVLTDKSLNYKKLSKNEYLFQFKPLFIAFSMSFVEQVVGRHRVTGSLRKDLLQSVMKIMSSIVVWRVSNSPFDFHYLYGNFACLFHRLPF